MVTQPYIGPRYCSLFGWGRPPLPWNLADKINLVLNKHQIMRVGVTGSLCPSVLVALGDGAPDRKIHAYVNYSRWDDAESWNYMIEDSPGMEADHPWAKVYLPVDFNLWDGATPFMAFTDAIFTDLPLSHRAVGLGHVRFNPERHRLLLMGFLERYAGPDDVLQWAREHDYTLSTFSDTIHCVETEESLTYQLVIAERLAGGIPRRGQ